MLNDRADAHLPARRHDVLHRRVEERRVEEPDAHLVDALRDLGRAEVEAHAEGLDHVRRPAEARDRAVPVLGHLAGPAPATTNAVAVETLNVPDASPPVPAVSISISRSVPASAVPTSAASAPARP